MTWLFAFVIAHAPMYSLNKWACDTVNSQPGATGCYDWCFEHSAWVNTDGVIHDDSKVGEIVKVDAGKMPQYLPGSYSHELQNACAVVMDGGEY